MDCETKFADLVVPEVCPALSCLTVLGTGGVERGIVVCA